MHWYLMSFSATRFNHVLKFLADKDVNYCCPMVAYHYQRPDKVNSVRKRLSPAFPGYVFVELDLTDNKLLTFSQCRYIQRLIAFGGEPVTVHQKVIDELSNRTFEECKCESAKWHLNRSQFGIRIDHDLASISDHSLASQSITIWHASDH